MISNLSGGTLKIDKINGEFGVAKGVAIEINAPHGLGGGPEIVAAAIPDSVLGRAQSEIGFMDEGSGLVEIFSGIMGHHALG